MFSCQITYDENFFANLPGLLVTYTYEAIVNYTYTKNQTGQIWVDRDYPCYTRVTNDGWYSFFVKNCTESPESCEGEIKDENEKYWYNPEFKMNSSWVLTTLPDKNWGCENCVKFYRRKLDWDGKSTIWLNITADDAAVCYVNGNLYNPALIEKGSNCGPCSEFSESFINFLIDTLNAALNIIGVGITFGDVSYDSCPPLYYSYNITGNLTKGTNNIIACSVVNGKKVEFLPLKCWLAGFGGDSLFEVNLVK